MDQVQFLSEDISFILENQSAHVDWFSAIVEDHNRAIGEFSFVFCTDDRLLEINREVLNHDYYTDIITFPLHVDGAIELVAEFYISIERVKDNANGLKVDFNDELDRVMIHGILHLLGYDDKTDALKEAMRLVEDKSLERRNW